MNQPVGCSVEGTEPGRDAHMNSRLHAGLQNPSRVARQLPGRRLVHRPRSLEEGELVPRAVASLLGIHDRRRPSILDSVVTYLSSRRMLLVLDNCEVAVLLTRGLSNRQIAEHFLIEAMGHLRERGYAARMRIVGDGDMRAPLTRQVAAARLEECVALLESRPQE